MLDAVQKERLQALSTALVADAMWQIGLEEMVDPAIRPVVPFARMIGSAVTVKFKAIESHEYASLSHYQEVLSKRSEYFAPVLVLELPPDRHRHGIFGEGAAAAARAAGYVGALVDGAVRDSHELKEQQFPVFSRALAMGFIIGKVASVSCNEPVVIGGVLTFPGDIVFADNDGALIIPQKRLAEIVDRAEAIMDWERRFHGLLREGKSFSEIERIVGPMPGIKQQGVERLSRVPEEK